MIFETVTPQDISKNLLESSTSNSDFNPKGLIFWTWWLKTIMITTPSGVNHTQKIPQKLEYSPINDSMLNYETNFADKFEGKGYSFQHPRTWSSSKNIGFEQTPKLYKINRSPTRLRQPESFQKIRNPSAENMNAPFMIDQRSKKSQCCNEFGCRMCIEDMNAYQVVHNYENYFADIPLSLLKLSEMGGLQNRTCGSFSVPLFPVKFHNEDILPAWIKGADVIGWCPSILTMRRLGHQVFPSQVVEHKCLCNQSKCSHQGVDFRCVPCRISKSFNFNDIFGSF